MADIAPWPFDILTRVIRIVREKGGVFICGGTAFAETPLEFVVWRNEMLTQATTANWSEAFRKSEASVMTPYCCAYAAVGANPDLGVRGNPVFIMAGVIIDQTLEPADLNRLTQFIYTSTDGKTWTETHKKTNGICVAAAWDEKEKRFLVQACTDFAYGVADFTYEILASSDGNSWSRIESEPGTGFASHAMKTMENTGNPLVKDVADQIVPNGGYYGWDKNSDIIITPKELQPYAEGTPAHGDNTIEIIKRNVDPETGAVTITRETKTLEIEKITGVAFAGGIWQAAGFMAGAESSTVKIATSTDDGETWTLDFSVETNVEAYCIVGAPPEMFT